MFDISVEKLYNCNYEAITPTKRFQREVKKNGLMVISDISKLLSSDNIINFTYIDHKHIFYFEMWDWLNDIKEIYTIVIKEL